ncbi:hypothetical protein LTS18_012234 [Coniosporium uncinatum]|uniref:Uncharacterized protein n=1 Tax=Coniosporium uncinatum TaxID=93489 RepID=A0ACC3DWE0_9PEZI|nr:hypothetical protein LTS18_012234 [Coniosporium uncinatum]
MAKFAGAALRIGQTILYALEFCCAGIILGIFSYFLSVLADRNVSIPTWEKAVEGLSGAAVIYLIFAVILTCFLGGIAFFAFLGIVLDVLFCGAMIAIAVMTRHGANSCSGNVNTPLGTGQSNSNTLGGYGGNGFGTGANQNLTYAASLGFACRLNTVAFAVSIIAAVLFLVSALVQLFIGKHHKKEKRYGPSPSNDYTSGSGNRFWKRKSKDPRTTHGAYDKDTELGTTGALAPAAVDVRPSHDTAYTGSTVGAGNHMHASNKYEPPATAGYYTAPVGSSVNPYGYDNTRTTANF